MANATFTVIVQCSVNTNCLLLWKNAVRDFIITVNTVYYYL